MSILIKERHMSRRVSISKDAPRVTRLYWLRGTYEWQEAVEAMVAASDLMPSSYEGLWLENFDVEVVPTGDGGLWDVVADYARKKRRDPDDPPEIEYTVGSATARFTHGLEVLGAYAPEGLVAPDFQGAIHVEDGHIEGVDLPTPIESLSVTKRLRASDVAATYADVLGGITHTVNNATITFTGLGGMVRTFQEGELFFRGHRSRLAIEHADDQTKIMFDFTYEFDAQRNATGLQIGNITGIDKPGWAYLWTLTEKRSESETKSLVQLPRAVYVHRMFYPADHSLIRV